jgi:CDP-glucose 4,6-dehydratase
MLNFFQNAKVLITGHTGFKGSWLTVILRRRCKEVMGVSLPISAENKFFIDLGIEKKIKSEYINLIEFDQIDKLIKNFRPDYVFHFAAQSLVETGYVDPITTFKSNVIGTQNLLESLYRNEVNATTIIATTDKVYRNNDFGIPFKETDELGGFDPYSASKAATEHLIYCYYKSYFEAHKAKIGVARAGNVVGGGDWNKNRIIPDIVRAASDGTTLKIRAPESTRPWQHVLEPLFGYLKFARWLDRTNTPNFEVLNFGPDQNNVRPVKDVVSQMGLYLPKFRVAMESPKNKEAISLSLNVDKARTLLGVGSKLNFEQTIHSTASWYTKAKAGTHPLYLCEQDISDYLTDE